VEISKLVGEVKKMKLAEGEYAVFGSAVMAIRGLREAPNIDVIVKNSLWDNLSDKYQVDSEGFIRIGLIKISNWWFAPLRKEISVLIDEAETIDGLRFVKIEEVLAYKKKLKGDKDVGDVKLIEKYIDESEENKSGGYGVNTYKDVLDLFVGKVEKNIPEIISIVLFGSVTRNQAKGDSDIDMFVFFNDEEIRRDEVNKRMNKILLEIRKSSEYKRLEIRGILPEIYPFFISKSKSNDLLWVFLDALLDGIIVFDKKNFGKKLIVNFKNTIESMGGRRVSLNGGGWCWILFDSYKKSVKNLIF